MKCERAQAWFSDLVDGSIGSAEKVILDAHLRACASCSNEVRRLTALWKAIDEMPDVPAPTNLRATIWQRIEAQSAQDQPLKPARSRRSLWARGLAFAGAAAVVALLATVTVPGKFRPAGLGNLFGIGAERKAAFTHARIENGPDGVRMVSVRVDLPTQDASRIETVVVYARDAKGNVYETKALVADGRADAKIKLPADAEAPVSVTAKWNTAGGASGSLAIHGVR